MHPTPHGHKALRTYKGTITSRWRLHYCALIRAQQTGDLCLFGSKATPAPLTHRGGQTGVAGRQGGHVPMSHPKYVRFQLKSVQSTTQPSVIEIFLKHAFEECCRSTWWQIRHGVIGVDVYGHLASDEKARNGANISSLRMAHYRYGVASLFIIISFNKI